ARAFNQPTVSQYFNLIHHVITKHNIPWRNIYNMDEKGCQRGGGHGKSRIKYLLSR
ncbi:hypothetical protein BDN67DRAFT_875192, partial [Paxillus ammoniavirescens]